MMTGHRYQSPEKADPMTYPLSGNLRHFGIRRQICVYEIRLSKALLPHVSRGPVPPGTPPGGAPPMPRLRGQAHQHQILG